MSMSESFATGGFHGLSYIKEETRGVTPLNPQMKNVRHTSCSLILTKESLQSAELRSDAQISDLRHGNKQASGDIGIELSFGDFDDFLAAVLRSEWTDDLTVAGKKNLIAGVQTQSFTFERTFNDIKQYQHFTGCEINTMSLSIQPNAMVTGTMGIIGRGVGFTSSALDPDPDKTNGGAPLDGFSGSLLEGGVPVSTVVSIELNINNGKEAVFSLGSSSASGVVSGRINISGTLTAYFENMDLVRKFVDELESSISIQLGNGIDSSYILTLPRLKYSSGDNPVDSEGVITLSMAFQALYDECTGTNILIERLPSIPLAPCELTYAGTEVNESRTVPGTVTDTIDIALTGGNDKTFLGTVGGVVPGVSIMDVPAGLTAAIYKIDPFTGQLRISGTADNAIANTDISVQFTAASFMAGYCNCPGGAMTNTTQLITILPA